ncbi:DEAD-box ATP-dependent RNA helicase 39 [Tanacetum coccineum]
MYNTSISTHPLQTLHFLKVPENSLEMLKVLENKFESLKVLENNLKSLKVLENNLESLKLQENRLVMENKFELLKVLENNLKLLKVLENNLESLKLQENRLVDGLDEAIIWHGNECPDAHVPLSSPTWELCIRVAKSISHHARFWSTMVSGGGRIRPQEEALNSPIDMVVGTPGTLLQNIEEGNLVYGDINISSAPLVLDEADMMFDRGFGPDIRKFLAPLNNRALKADGLGFQTVLVTATMINGIQKLVDEEFQGIEHIRTPTLHKKVAAARHDFIKLSGAKNKLEALLQVVFEPKFKSNDGDCPTLVCIVCTDLAARGLDLNVHQKWIEGGNYELCIEDVRNEIWDMVKPADPLRITLSDLPIMQTGGTDA